MASGSIECQVSNITRYSELQPLDCLCPAAKTTFPFTKFMPWSRREKVRGKKFPTLECYESGEVRDGMKKR